ncbi:hypothetical protein CONLIGDRAFT_108191 [Coniochaeta ligniaria NRRL 30616]|uniref:Uncharacterized protein n=1 Tax=Coniochaeta ligniaria NRRL 30616 TaxID=1408157 RepID=A0A1J7I9B9_9PEZI|nr:hypothetical protein CONLIGDRAFT_108191 [Coniochaeta ligniaria NRRL 30616]
MGLQSLAPPDIRRTLNSAGVKYPTWNACWNTTALLILPGWGTVFSPRYSRGLLTLFRYAYGSIRTHHHSASQIGETNPDIYRPPDDKTDRLGYTAYIGKNESVLAVELQDMKLLIGDSWCSIRKKPARLGQRSGRTRGGSQARPSPDQGAFLRLFPLTHALKRYL